MIKKYSVQKIIISSLFFLYFIHIAWRPQGWHFIDAVNLVFHEAGHTCMIFFGDFIHTAGGTLFQIGIPLLITLYFWKRGELFSASLTLFWVGQNFINASVYAGDAIVQVLPLLGDDGSGSGHDWTNMLSMLGILKYSSLISTILFYCGLIIVLLAFYLSIINSRKDGTI